MSLTVLSILNAFLMWLMAMFNEYSALDCKTNVEELRRVLALSKPALSTAQSMCWSLAFEEEESKWKDDLKVPRSENFIQKSHISGKFKALLFNVGQTIVFTIACADTKSLPCQQYPRMRLDFLPPFPNLPCQTDDTCKWVQESTVSVKPGVERLVQK